MDERPWAPLAQMQAGLLGHRQLRELGVSRGEIRNHLRVGRWAVRSDEVISTTTGPLSPEQALWLGVLHGGPSAMEGALNAATSRGLKRWERDEITILVSNPHSFAPLPGYRFFRTRRPYKVLLGPGDLPACRLEPAVLVDWIDRLAPLRRSRGLRELLTDVTDGAHSMAEVDLRKACRRFGVQQPTSQRPRRDGRGRARYTDAEWRLPDGRVVVLEVDGGWHDDPEQSTQDRRRNRRLTNPRRMVVQCSAWEIRHEPWEVMQDLVALGVPTLG